MTRYETPFDVDTITVQRPRKYVENGSVYETWADPLEHDEPGCSITPGPSDEDHDRADGVTIAYTVQAPLEADVHEHDRVRFTYGGRTHEGLQVHGRPRPFADPLGLVGHLIVELTEREG